MPAIAQLLRIKGDLLLRHDATDAAMTAEAHFRQALDGRADILWLQSFRSESRSADSKC
jgi:hypothetical protein